MDPVCSRRSQVSGRGSRQRTRQHGQPQPERRSPPVPAASIWPRSRRTRCADWLIRSVLPSAIRAYCSGRLSSPTDGAPTSTDDAPPEQPEGQAEDGQSDQADAHAGPGRIQPLVLLGTPAQKAQIGRAGQRGHGDHLSQPGRPLDHRLVLQTGVQQIQRHVAVETRHAGDGQHPDQKGTAQDRAAAQDATHLAQGGHPGGVHHRAGAQEEQRFEQGMIDQLEHRTGVSLGVGRGEAHRDQARSGTRCPRPAAASDRPEPAPSTPRAGREAKPSPVSSPSIPMPAGRTSSPSRTRATTPRFTISPENKAETAPGTGVCASGSQAWKGARPALMAKPPTSRAVATSAARPGLPREWPGATDRSSGRPSGHRAAPRRGTPRTRRRVSTSHLEGGLQRDRAFQEEAGQAVAGQGRDLEPDEQVDACRRSARPRPAPPAASGTARPARRAPLGPISPNSDSSAVNRKPGRAARSSRGEGHCRTDRRRRRCRAPGRRTGARR